MLDKTKHNSIQNTLKATIALFNYTINYIVEVIMLSTLKPSFLKVIFIKSMGTSTPQMETSIHTRAHLILLREPKTLECS